MGGTLLVSYVMKSEELKNSEEFLQRSLMSPKQLLDFDRNGDGEINKYEYLRHSLLQCRFVTEDKIDLIMSKFNDLDTDKSGSISISDFKKLSDIPSKTPNKSDDTGIAIAE